MPSIAYTRCDAWCALHYTEYNQLQQLFDVCITVQTEILIRMLAAQCLAFINVLSPPTASDS